MARSRISTTAGIGTVSNYLLYVVCLYRVWLGQVTLLIFTWCISLISVDELWRHRLQASFLVLQLADRNGLVSPSSPSQFRMEIVASSGLLLTGEITRSKTREKLSCWVRTFIRQCCRWTATETVIHWGLELVMPEFYNVCRFFVLFCFSLGGGKVTNKCRDRVCDGSCCGTVQWCALPEVALQIHHRAWNKIHCIWGEAIIISLQNPQGVLHRWLSGLHNSPAAMEEPLRPAGKPPCEQKVHYTPTPGHVRSGWAELTEMIFCSNMCRFTFRLRWENAAGTKQRGDGGNQHCPLQLSSALPRRLGGRGCPTGPGSAAVLGQGLLSPGM